MKFPKKFDTFGTFTLKRPTCLPATLLSPRREGSRSRPTLAEGAALEGEPKHVFQEQISPTWEGLGYNITCCRKDPL